VLGTSKLVRAVETAALIAKGYDIKSSLELPFLAPGGKQAELLAWLKKQNPAHTIAFIGHEPDLGRTASWLLSGMRASFMPMKKGGACLLQFDRAIESGAARLLWSIPPKQLRKLR
jgi:phosphohistidine phosphatase